MKKMLTLALALVMALTLAACGGGQSGGDVDYVKEKGTLIVGMTDFAPMDYRDESGEWIGFDADMAKAFAKSLGVEVQFVEINWDNKAMELETKAIDAVWNGMTLTDDVKALMGTSEPYCMNAQVVVLSAALDWVAALTDVVVRHPILLISVVIGLIGVSVLTLRRLLKL